MKKGVILTFFLSLCSLVLWLSACNSLATIDGNNQAKVSGIKLTVYDENNKVIDTISSTTSNDNTKLLLKANTRYIIEVGLVQSGGSANANILADSIMWIYDGEIITVTKCNDNENDARYYVECKKINETTNLTIKIDDLYLELSVCFEEQNICGHTNKILVSESFVSNAGYCSDDDLVSGSLNFEKFGNSKQEHLIIYKFDFLTEFTNFQMQYQDRLSFEELLHGLNITDDTYFADKSLLLIYKFTTDASLRYDVYGVYVDNKTLCIHICQNDISDDGIKKKDGWFLALLLRKEQIDDITYFDAVLEE